MFSYLSPERGTMDAWTVDTWGYAERGYADGRDADTRTDSSDRAGRAGHVRLTRRWDVDTQVLPAFSRGRTGENCHQPEG